MKKKVLALLFVIIAAVCVFIACSQGAPSVTDTGTSKTSETAAVTEPPVEESAEVKKYRERNASFKTEDFGTVGKYERNFTSKIGTPPVSPTAGEHPRVMFNSDDLATIIANLETDANNSAYRTLVSFARKTIKSASKGGELDLVELGRVEAMAFYYALTGDALYAQKAIYAIKQTILDVDCEKDFDPYRGYGAVMYVAGCVYDWCYDQLTEADRDQIVFGTLKNLASRMEVGCPPSKEGAISHHTVECQIQKSYLSFAIAVYDEYPNIYNYVAKRLISNIAPAQNYFIASGMHWEGTAYGPFRGCYLMYAQILFSAMTHGQYQLYDYDSLHRLMLTYIDFRVPGGYEDGSTLAFETGDQAGTGISGVRSVAFLSGGYFNDANLLTLGRGQYNESTPWDSTKSYDWITPTEYLILNRPETASLGHCYDGIKLANVISYPKSSIFARSSYDSDGVGVFMTMVEDYTSSHSHPDCGSFQIYYKGYLASESGVYDSYGSEHHYSYGFQTISSNSLLILNTNSADRAKINPENRYYSGGQTMRNYSRLRCPYTLDDFLKSINHDQAAIFGKVADADTEKYHFSYLAGDMTGAYDPETVDEVTRHMISVMTDDENCPMVFVTFDRITSDKAEYPKIWLLHSHKTPTVEDGIVTVSNGKGKLVTQSLFNDMKITVYGDDESCYTVNGRVFTPTQNPAKGSEYRVELTPQKKSGTDRFLEVMYVTESGNTVVTKAEEIDSTLLMGTEILGKVIMFAKDTNSLDGEASFSVKAGGELEYFIGGVRAGRWQVSVNGSRTVELTVGEGEGILTFTAPGGDVTVKRIS